VDLVTNRLTALPLIEAITGGHDGYGFGVRVNRIAARRPLGCCAVAVPHPRQPLVTFDLITSVLLPKESTSRITRPGTTLSRSARTVRRCELSAGDNTTPWRVDEKSSGADRRRGRRRNGVALCSPSQHRGERLNPLEISFWNTPRANVSPDGRWRSSRPTGQDAWTDPGMRTTASIVRTSFWSSSSSEAKARPAYRVDHPLMMKWPTRLGPVFVNAWTFTA